MSDKRTEKEILNELIKNQPPGDMIIFSEAEEKLIYKAMQSYHAQFNISNEEIDKEKRFLLEGYSEFLEEHGHIDSDWREEEPFPIDEFLKQDKIFTTKQE